MKITMNSIGRTKSGLLKARAPFDNIHGELLSAIACHQPVRIRKGDGRVFETDKILHHGAGWCTTAHGTYTIQLQASFRRSLKPGERSNKLIDCDLTWANPSDIVTAVFESRSKGVLFNSGSVRAAFGFREALSHHFARALVGFESGIRHQHGCDHLTVSIGLRGLISAAASEWYHGLIATNFDRELVVLYHEIEICTGAGFQRFRFVSVLHREIVTYCTIDELPLVDREVGDNQKRLRSIIEIGEP